MPYKPRKNYKKKFPKNKTPKKQNAYKSTNLVPVQNYGIKVDPFPARLRTRCKYVYNYRLQTDAVLPISGNEQSFRLNSGWDPNFTDVTGDNNTSAVGWGIFKQLYDRYIVNGCKIELEFSDPSKDGIAGVASLNQGSVLQSKSYRDIIQQPLTYTTILNNTGSQKKKMLFYVKPWSLHGISKLEYMANSTKYSAQIEANPADAIYLRLAVTNASESDGTVSNTMQVSMRIFYDITFYNRYTLHPGPP